MTYYQMISYDLRKPGRDYKNLHAAIKTISGSWCRPVESVWIVPTTMNYEELRNHLLPFIDINDRLVVLTLQSGWATYNVSKVCTDWLQGQFG